jgi:hypothetical protein
MKKLSYLIVIAVILGLTLTGCSLLSNISQVPATEQSGIAYLTKSFSNLVGLWHFDGNADDSSVNGNDGTVNGGWVDGKFGKALSFNGVDEYVSIPDSASLDLSGEITVEAWIKVDVHKNHNAIVIKGEDGAENYELLLTSSGLLYSTIKFMDGSRYYPSVPSAITDTEWHHVAMTYKPGEWRIYVDGIQMAEITNVSKTPAEQYLGSFREERFFNGTIDEVRIWSTALTADQLILYNDYSGLLAPYKGPDKAFKSGSSIPLRWQYTTDDLLVAVNSSTANPSIKIDPVEPSGEPIDGTLIVADDPGSSGYHYDSETNTWHFNWKTEGYEAGDYNIYIINDWTGQTFGPCLIKLR